MAITKIEVPELFDFGSDNSAFKLPTGTTAERPTSPSNGEMRFNTTTGYVEYYDTTDTQWWEIDYAPSFASKNFNSVLYTGNSGTQAITGVGFQPDLVWIKARDFSYNHRLFDSVRNLNGRLESNTTAAEVTNTINDNFVSFDSNGFTLGATSSTNGSNDNNKSYVAWNWKAGGTAVSNTDGTMTSLVSANQAAGFSIVQQTSNNSNDTIGHGLSAAPELIISKNQSISGPWGVYNASNGVNGYLYFNEADAHASAANVYPIVNSTVFSGGSGGWNNGTGNVYINYCFHSVAGYSKIGSYTWTGTSYTAGTMVTNLGFEPSFVMIKGINLTSNWQMYDNKRVSGTQSYALYADLSDAEVTTGYQGIGFDSDGFSAIVGADGNTTASSSLNQSGETYIYMAFAAT